MHKKTWLIGMALAGAAFIAADAFLLEKYFFEIKTYRIGNKQKNGPFVKILLLADLHLGTIHSYHKRLARTIRRIQPDIIFISGDALDEHGKKSYLAQFLAMLPISIPKAAILGNHEYKAHPDTAELCAIYRKYNCELLVNASKAYSIAGRQIMVTGMDDFIEGKADLNKAIAGVGREAHHFVLIHSPLQQEKLLKGVDKLNANRKKQNQLNISYLFAGHNHGGQVSFFGMAPVLPEKSGNYVNGWYNEQQPYLYVSRGFGTSTLPVRFGARAEVTLFRYYV